MDALTTFEKVLALRWDAPYRIAASALGIAALVGLFLSKTSLEALAALSDYVGWPNGGARLLVGREWLLERGAAIAWIGVMLLAARVLFAHRGRRGGATAWLGVALCAETANIAPFIALGLVIVAYVLSRLFMHRWSSDFMSPERQVMGQTLTALVGGLLYVVAAPASWALTR